MPSVDRWICFWLPLRSLVVLWYCGAGCGNMFFVPVPGIMFRAAFGLEVGRGEQGEANARCINIVDLFLI